MKYLVSVRPETIAVEDKDKWAPQDIPVVPAFPAPPRNHFLAIGPFKDSQYARVVDDPSIDIDDLAEALHKEYPGIPKHIHDQYVLATAKAAHGFMEGMVFGITIEYHQAQLHSTDGKWIHTLWEKHPS